MQTSPDTNPSKHAILENAVELYSSLHPDCNQTIISTLEELWQQRRTLKKEYKAVKQQANIISRNIGDAKRTGKPVDDLKADMQQYSKQLKSISEQLENNETRILDFFNTSINASKSKTDATFIIDERIYDPSLSNDSTISISLLDDGQEEWNAYIAGNSAASIYHRAEWRQLIQKTYGLESHYFKAQNQDKQTVGVLPLIRLKSRLFGDLLVSMPYFMTGGALAEHPSIEQKLIQAANDHAAALGIDHIEYRDEIPREPLPVRTEKVNMTLPLPDSQEELWKSFTSKLRSQIRRPQREDVKIRFGGAEYLDDFYTVYARNMRDLGSPVHSKQFVKSILNHFPDKSRIVVLSLNNWPVSAGLLVDNGDTLDIPLASTIRDVNHLSMNMLLYWEVLKYAVERRYKYFNFGRSTVGAGTYRFKQQWGAQPKQLYWHYWLNGTNELPSLNPSNPKYTLMISTWKRLPVAFSNLIGPMIVKNLP